MAYAEKGQIYHPTICVTQNCNLNCVYCYQKHDATKHLTFETAKKIIDEIFVHYPSGSQSIEISFIGGEPLLEFKLLQKIYDYAATKNAKIPYYFFATTNGTVLTDEMKEWFTQRKEKFYLGFSLDGTPETHNHNRSNSFSKIDIDFFKNNWPKQGVKMTLTEFSLKNFANDIKFIHSLNFSSINGVNLFEGDYDWDKDEYIKILAPQLEELVKFYVENDDLPLNQMFNKNIAMLDSKTRTKRKYCGIGTGTVFYDTDGIKRPCSYCTPMTFSKEELEDIAKTDFTNESNFVDDECFEKCYLYPLCPHCAGANYLAKKSFKEWDKSKCRIHKLIFLYIADLTAKRILKNPSKYSDNQKYHSINAIKKIKELYLEEFKNILK